LTSRDNVARQLLRCTDRDRLITPLAVPFVYIGVAVI
jgi:hypothetical protein